MEKAAPKTAPAPAVLGLRERKKIAMKDTLSKAALHLAMTKGMDALTIEDIVAEANVSVRTFGNYFNNKYEALTASYVNRMRLTAQELRDRPADEPLWDAIIQAITRDWNRANHGQTNPPPQLLAELRLLIGNSNLRGEILKASFADDEPFAQAVAERTGLDVRHDIYPRLVAAAVTAITQVAGDWFLFGPSPTPLVPLMVNALEQLAKGLPVPAAMQKSASPPSLGRRRLRAGK